MVQKNISMKTIYIKYWGILLAFLIAGFAGCKKMDDTYRVFLKDGETIYVGKADSLRVHGGKGRIELTWLLISDPKVRSYKVYWDNRKDSVTGTVTKTAAVDTVHVMLNNMAEGVHYFEVYMFDDDGHSSVGSEVTGNAYGTLYEQSMLTRTIKNMRRIGNDVEINWTSADAELLFVQLRYKNDQGDTVDHFVPASAELDTLEDMSINTMFSYRSALLPDSMALDTFYTEYTAVDYEEYVKNKGMTLSFSTTVQYGDQEDQFSVLVSTDFSGNATMEDIHNASWTDVTDAFGLASSTEHVTWGPEDLVQHMADGKPIYIAFRYITLPQGDNGKQRTWKVSSFEIKNKDGAILYDLPSSEFTLLHEGPFEEGRSSISSSTITLRGNKVSTEDRTEDWAVSKAIIF